MVAARLERHVNRGARGIFTSAARGSQSVDLRMALTSAYMPAFTDNPRPLRNHTAHARVGVCRLEPPRGERESPVHGEAVEVSDHFVSVSTGSEGEASLLPADSTGSNGN